MDGLLVMALGFIALVVSWKFWKRTVRDCVRDDLFDIRDEWRSYWIDRGMDMGKPAYSKFRRDVNSYLRYTSTYRFSDLIYVHRHTSKISAVLSAYDEGVIYCDPDTLEQMRRLRSRAVAALQAYMVMTSIFLFPVMIIATAACFFKRLSFMVSFFKSSVKVANSVPYSRPEFIQQAVRLQPRCV